MKQSSWSKLFPSTVTFIEEAKKDFLDLDHTQQVLVAKAIKKVSENPAPASEGGYGKPLGNRASSKLAGYLKIKLKHSGLRVVYRYVKTNRGMKVIVIDIRDEEAVYEEAIRRLQK